MKSVICIGVMRVRHSRANDPGLDRRMRDRRQIQGAVLRGVQQKLFSQPRVPRVAAPGTKKGGCPTPHFDDVGGLLVERR